MNASQLKALIESKHPESLFFSRRNMRFSGDTMRNYGVRGPFWITRYCGPTVAAWELYRRKPVKHGLQKSAYFDAKTFEQIHGDVKDDVAYRGPLLTYTGRIGVEFGRD